MNDGTYNWRKIIDYIGPSPRLMLLDMFVQMVQSKKKSHLKESRKKILVFIDPITNEEKTELDFDTVVNIYNLVTNEHKTTDITMKNKLKKHANKLTRTEKVDGIGNYSIYSTSLVRSLFANPWNGRTLIGDSYVPLGYR